MDHEDAIFKDACEYRDGGNLGKAVSLLKGLVKNNPTLVNAYLLLGDIYDDLGKYDKAVEAFSHAVRSKPKSELASRCLFHALIDVQNVEGALKEAARFSRLNGTMNYKHLAQELKNLYELLGRDARQVKAMLYSKKNRRHKMNSTRQP